MAETKDKEKSQEDDSSDCPTSKAIAAAEQSSWANSPAKVEQASAVNNSPTPGRAQEHLVPSKSVTSATTSPVLTKTEIKSLLRSTILPGYFTMPFPGCRQYVVQVDALTLTGVQILFSTKPCPIDVASLNYNQSAIITWNAKDQPGISATLDKLVADVKALTGASVRPLWRPGYCQSGSSDKLCLNLHISGNYAHGIEHDGASVTINFPSMIICSDGDSLLTMAGAAIVLPTVKAAG